MFENTAIYAQMRTQVNKLLADRNLSTTQLVQKIVDLLGPNLDVSRVCYNELRERVYVTVVEWTDGKNKPTLGQKVSARIGKNLITEDLQILTSESAIELLPTGLRVIAKPVLGIMGVLQSVIAIVALPIFIDGELDAVFSCDICRDLRDKTEWSDYKKRFMVSIVRSLATELERRKVAQSGADGREAALLVMDVVKSTNLLLKDGDDQFSTHIKEMHRRFLDHYTASDLLFLKCTGDGFLAVYDDVSPALTAARSFLQGGMSAQLPLRMALHWGNIKSGPDGDPLGVEVHRVFRMEGLTEEERVGIKRLNNLPEQDRILATREAVNRLGIQEKVFFKQVGRFSLKGFSQPCEIFLANKADVTSKATAR
jgi:class 3 adenylate cyclase